MWVGGPPCGVWSKRNHDPSLEERQRATEFLDRILDYVRTHKPAIAILESVHVPANHAVMDATVRSMRAYGYEDSRVEVEAAEDVPMGRDRGMWLMTR